MRNQCLKCVPALFFGGSMYKEASGRAAVRKLADMASRGTPAPTVYSAAASLFRSWKGEGVPLSSLRHRLQDLQIDIDAGVVAAEEFVATAETDPERRSAVAQLDALNAIRSAIDAELDHLFVGPVFSEKSNVSEQRTPG